MRLCTPSRHRRIVIAVKACSIRFLALGCVAVLWPAAAARAQVEIHVVAENAVRVFADPNPPRVMLVLHNRSDQPCAGAARVDLRAVHRELALPQKNLPFELASGEKAEFNLCDPQPDGFGIFKARVELTGGASGERALRWARVPSLPRGKKWSLLGLNVHDLEADEIVELEALGVQWVRTNWNWENLAPRGINGEVDWNVFQRQADLARRHDLKIMAMLAAMTPPPWARIDGRPKYYFDIGEFERYATAVLDRVGADVAAVQLYNEPDWGIAEGLGQKDREISEAEDRQWRAFLAEYIHRAARFIHEKYPHILVVGPGFPSNPTDPGPWEEMLDPPHRIGTSLDVFAWHNYPAPRGGAPDSGKSAVIGMERFLRRAKPKVRGGKFWVTEQGYSTVDNTRPPYDDRKRWDWAWPVGTTEKQQGDYLVRLVLLQWEAGLDRTFLFALNRDPLEEVGDGNAYYGLSSHRLQYQKLSFAQLAAMGHFLIDAQFVGRAKLGGDERGTHALCFRSGPKKILVIWSAEGGAEVALPTEWHGAQVFDGFGNARAPSQEAVQVDEQPIYLVKRPAESR